MTSPAVSIKEAFCVVCGAGSHREDWQGVEYPACDSHSTAEVSAALAKLQAAKAVAQAPAPAPVPEPEPSIARSKVEAFLKSHGFSDEEIDKEIAMHGVYALFRDAASSSVPEKPTVSNPAPTPPASA